MRRHIKGCRIGERVSVKSDKASEFFHILVVMGRLCRHTQFLRQSLGVFFYHSDIGYILNICGLIDLRRNRISRPVASPGERQKVAALRCVDKHSPPKLQRFPLKINSDGFQRMPIDLCTLNRRAQKKIHTPRIFEHGEQNFLTDNGLKTDRIRTPETNPHGTPLLVVDQLHSVNKLLVQSKSRTAQIIHRGNGSPCHLPSNPVRLFNKSHTHAKASRLNGGHSSPCSRSCDHHIVVPCGCFFRRKSTVWQAEETEQESKQQSPFFYIAHHAAPYRFIPFISLLY